MSTEIPAHETPRRFVSVKFSPIGRPQTFLLNDLLFADAPPVAGDKVVVQSEAGSAVGVVVSTPSAVHGAAAARPSILPIASSGRRPLEDVIVRLKRQHREQEAHRVALLKIRERGLEMKLTRVEQLFDGSRLIFYFTAEGRVDFRELVRELASEFHTRIEMRQIGARDEAKMLGGYGSCGRPLCCTTWLNAFEPVSIKMAKQQDLSLNPSRLSGLCGRLKCCLRYELPNAKGVKGGGCGDEGGCGNPTGCGTGGGCGSCGDGCGSADGLTDSSSGERSDLRSLIRIPISMSLPRIGITAGDPAGIGPEIARKAMADSRVRAVCEPLYYGSQQRVRPGRAVGRCRPCGVRDHRARRARCAGRRHSRRSRRRLSIKRRSRSRGCRGAGIRRCWRR